MNGASRDVAFEPRLHLLQNRTTICVFPESDDREQDCLFKCTEVIGHSSVPTL